MIKMNGDITRPTCGVADISSMVCGDGTVFSVVGIIHNIRDMRDFVFIVLRTSEGFLQCVYDKKHDEREKELLKVENSVVIRGEKKADDRIRNGFEILVHDIKVLSSPKEELPIAIGKKVCKLSLETDTALRPVTLRNANKRAVFKLQEGLARGFRSFLYSNGFTEAFTPKIVAHGAEGGANIFKLDYFGKKAYLAQSPQFYKQTLIPVYERVFEIAQVYRAEKHDTNRHLNEYISVDLEMGFINSFYDIMNMETAMLRYTMDFLRTEYSSVLETLKLTSPEINEIPAVKFSEAKEMVSAKYNRRIKDPYDLEPEEERCIGEIFAETENSDFVFVTHYPSAKRPFYAMDDPENPKYTLSFDLLYRGMEVTTGGQRIHNYDEQIEKMKKKGLSPEDYEDYLMLHKYGCPPHGGFGMGLERMCMTLLDEKNIRMASMFPRDTLRLTP